LQFGLPDKQLGERLSRETCCGRESEIDRLGGVRSFGGFRRFFDNLVLKKEKRRRRGLCGRCEMQRHERDFGGLRFLENSQSSAFGFVRMAMV